MTRVAAGPGRVQPGGAVVECQRALDAPHPGGHDRVWSVRHYWPSGRDSRHPPAAAPARHRVAACACSRVRLLPSPGCGVPLPSRRSPLGACCHCCTRYPLLPRNQVLFRPGGISIDGPAQHLTPRIADTARCTSIGGNPFPGPDTWDPCRFPGRPGRGAWSAHRVWAWLPSCRSAAHTTGPTGPTTCTAGASPTLTTDRGARLRP